MSLSSTEKETDSPCVPSRSVVSNVKIRIPGSLSGLLLGGGRLVFGHARFLLLLEERHHLAQPAAHALDLQIALRFPHGEEILAAGLILIDPLPRDLAGLHFGQNLAHLRAGLLVDAAGAARVVAVFAGAGNGEAHVAQAAL